MAYQTVGSILRLHHPFTFMSVSYAPLRPQRSESVLRRKGIMGSTCKSRLELPGAVIETWETDDDSEQIFKFARFFSADGRHIPLPLRKATRVLSSSETSHSLPSIRPRTDEQGGCEYRAIVPVAYYSWRCMFSPTKNRAP